MRYLALLAMVVVSMLLLNGSWVYAQSSEPPVPLSTHDDPEQAFLALEHMQRTMIQKGALVDDFLQLVNYFIEQNDSRMEQIDLLQPELTPQRYNEIQGEFREFDNYLQGLKQQYSQISSGSSEGTTSGQQTTTPPQTDWEVTAFRIIEHIRQSMHEVGIYDELPNIIDWLMDANRKHIAQNELLRIEAPEKYNPQITKDYEDLNKAFEEIKNDYLEYSEEAKKRFDENLKDVTPEEISPEENKVEEEKSDGKPIMFSLPEYGGIKKVDIWPEQHESFQEIFPLNNMCPVHMTVKYTSGFMLFWDHDYNYDITNGLELGWTPHHHTANAYDYFSGPMFDFNDNKILDRYDTLWHSIKVKDMATGSVYRPLDLGIVGFNLKHIDIPDDYVTPGMYADCKYEEDWAYDDYVREHGEDFCTPVSKDSFRTIAWSPQGVIMEDGTTYPSYDVTMGYWGETSDCC